MAQWRIEPSWKKSIIERCYYHKDGNTIMIETGWRWGTFETETEDDSPPKIESGTDLWCCDYEVEMIETWDGCWEEHDMDECDEETQEWLEEFFDEGNSWLDLEEHGWVQGDSEMIIDCDPVFTRLDGPDEGKQYDVDGDEIPSDDKEEEVVITETVKLEPQAKWPFERPQEGPKEYAEFKCTECDYTTDDIMELVDNPNDDDKGAYLCPECNGKVDLG